MKQTAKVVFFCAACLAAVSGVAYMTILPPSPDSILEAGRLAHLPSDASQVEVHSWKGIFTGESFLSFRASPESIKSWLKQSPSLQGFSARQTLYQGSRLAPKWFPSGAGGLKKMYAVPSHENHNWGNVIIDESTGTVYVCIVWS